MALPSLILMLARTTPTPRSCVLELWGRKHEHGDQDLRFATPAHRSLTERERERERERYIHVYTYIYIYVYTLGVLSYIHISSYATYDMFCDVAELLSFHVCISGRLS